MDANNFENFQQELQVNVANNNNDDKISKFCFLAKILQENPKATPDHTFLRPVKISRENANNKQPQESSAKNILKRTIIKQASNRFGEKARENFLMKGKMLNASRKPLQNQMASFLHCLNQRISREVEKNQKNEKISQLPSLSKQDFQTADSSTRKMHYQEIFKNLRELRIKKSEKDQSPPPPKINKKFRQMSHLDRKFPSRTISYNSQERKDHSQTVNNFKLPNTLGTISKEMSFKKGYLIYSGEAADFIKKSRINFQKSCQLQSERSKDITAKAYMVIDFENLSPISGRNVRQQIQIASLTKIMTCYLCLLACQKYNIDIFSFSVRVSQKAAQTPGTSAQLQSGDLLTIYELLYGLMLPSGNDASVAIAQTMGKIIQRYKKKDTKKSYYETFIANMNHFSRELQIEQTWNNSSGLSINPNFSTPQAIMLLTSLAMRHPLFNRIVNTKIHQIQVKNQRYGLIRKIQWRNTNKLLDNGWQGVKTGTTQNAGHCLMAKKDRLLVGVFDCQNNGRRFSQCVKLYDKYSISTTF